MRLASIAVALILLCGCSSGPLSILGLGEGEEAGCKSDDGSICILIGGTTNSKG